MARSDRNNVVGYTRCVIAIALHQRFVNFLDTRRTSAHKKRAKNAKQFYKLVQELRSGRRDKYLYFLRLVSAITIAFIVSFVGFMGAFIVIALMADTLPDYQLWPHNSGEWHRTAIVLGLFFIATIFSFMTFLGTRKFDDLRNALEDFETYERDFTAKWSAPPSEKLKKPDLPIKS